MEVAASESTVLLQHFVVPAKTNEEIGATTKEELDEDDLFIPDPEENDERTEGSYRGVSWGNFLKLDGPQLPDLLSDKTTQSWEE